MKKCLGSLCWLASERAWWTHNLLTRAAEWVRAVSYRLSRLARDLGYNAPLPF